MKTILIIILMIFFGTSCKKESTLPISPTLQLIQNDWTVISVRIFFPNGSNYLLLNDNQHFRKDNLRITKSGGIISSSLDTAKYNLLPDDSTLLFYQIRNGIQDNKGDTAFVKTITDHLFVYYFKRNDGSISFIDSLKR